MKAILQGAKLMYSKITVFLSNCMQGEKLDNLTTIINKQINKQMKLENLEKSCIK